MNISKTSEPESTELEALESLTGMPDERRSMNLGPEFAASLALEVAQHFFKASLGLSGFVFGTLPVSRGIFVASPIFISRMFVGRKVLPAAFAVGLRANRAQLCWE
jgi:hypothetical protein